jgi:hypothetical protein
MTRPDDPPTPPDPPPDLDRRELPLTELPPPVDWYRIHPAGTDPRFFGPDPRRPPKNRFDAPGGEYGTLYLGETFAACFAEVFPRQRSGMLLTAARIESSQASLGSIRRPLGIVRLHGEELAQIGATSASLDGGYDRSRRWAQAFVATSEPSGRPPLPPALPGVVRSLRRRDRLSRPGNASAVASKNLEHLGAIQGRPQPGLERAPTGRLIITKQSLRGECRGSLVPADL